MFYPKGLKQADELAYAASHLTSIEINATHYRLQSPKSFRKWAAAAPDGFVFSVKGPRLVTQQKVLAETGGFIERFLRSGLAELGDKLGPVLWQFAPFKQFDRDDFAKFLDHLPRDLDGLKLQPCGRGAPCEFPRPGLRHAAARHGIAAVVYRRRDLADDRRRDRRCRLCAAATGRRYARGRLSAQGARRLGRARASLGQGRRAERSSARRRRTPGPKAKPRDVFIYFIHEGKLRAPAAAMALIERLA